MTEEKRETPRPGILDVFNERHGITEGTSAPKILLNYYVVDPDAKGRPVKRGITAGEIAKQLDKWHPTWPRRVGQRLFAIGEEGVSYFDKTSQFYSWLAGSNDLVEWEESAGGALTKPEFMDYLRRTVQAYKAVTKAPHFPTKPEYYYDHGPLPENGEGMFEALLSFFSPATDLDRELLKALFMTPFWGGAPGSRPAFVITAEEDDEHGGRGVGKTTLLDTVARLCGGSIDFSSKMPDIDTAKRRLLTSNSQRVMRFDNVKANRFSNSDLEGLITATEVSGHRMYEGNADIPNDFTFIFTFNDVSFSKDMAQRAIPIKLARPKAYRADWQRAVEETVARYRWQIIAGIRDTFARQPMVGASTLRFSTWTEEVLWRVTTNPDAVKEILVAQKALDDEQAEGEEIESILYANLSRYRVREAGLGAMVSLNPQIDRCRILATLAARWVQEGLGRREGVRSTMKLIERARVRGLNTEPAIMSGYKYYTWLPLLQVKNTTCGEGVYRIDADFRDKEVLERDAYIRVRSPIR